jgi:proteasome accessory factor C
MSHSAAEQLRRILTLIPECADDRPHAIAEVAKRAGTDPTTLLQDVQALSKRFDDPGGFVEAVQIFVEPDRLEVRSDHFLRPMRLTVAEVGALELGLSLLAAERPPEEQPALSRAQDRLRDALAKLPDDGAADGCWHASVDTAADPTILSTLRHAYRQRRKTRITYHKAEAEAATERVVSPWAIVHASGHWYLMAQSDGTEGVRIFRIDRITHCELLAERYPLPDETKVPNVLRDRRAFLSEVSERVRIRFAPRIARWIAEREGAAPAADGSFVQELPLADSDWLVRYVLQYAAEVEVLEPPEARALVANRLHRILQELPHDGS